MPSLETPPNPAPLPPSPPEKLKAGRFGELEHHELVHLLDSLDDDRSRSRFRESIYISMFVYLALAWFVFYGPRVLFHQGNLVNPVDVHKRDKELTYLEVPKDLTKRIPPKSTKAISDQSTVAQTAHPSLDKKTLAQLEAMRRAGEPGAPASRPLPPAPTPQPASQAKAQAAPALPQPKPQPRPLPAQATPNIPDAPRPSSTSKPDFSAQNDPGQSIRQAAAEAARQRGQGGEGGANAPLSHQGQNTGAEVLSDTLGVDFGPYIRRLLRILKASWYPLIPEETRPPLNKEGTTLIRFSIGKNGVVSAMHLDNSTHDQAIDRAAWGSITGVGQFPPLPADFKGPELELRIQFNITHDRSQTE